MTSTETRERPLPLNAPKDGGYVRALDGLRGCAILFVLVYHFGWTFPETTPATWLVKRVFWTGWIGVDLFFALSGFLITQRLLASRKMPLGPALKRFWVRRFLRIFPLYYGMLIVGSALGFALGADVPGVSFWLYLQNYTIPFDPFDVIRWSSHLWSLAIEEQFYLVWPVLVLALSARGRPALALGLTALGFVARAAFATKLSPFPEPVTLKMTYTALPFRADGLLLGALGAFVVDDRASLVARTWRAVRTPIRWGGSAALLAMAVWTRGFDQYDRRVSLIGYALLALVFASFVVAAAEKEIGPVAQRLLESRALVALGKVSYAVYLLHWPLVSLTIAPLEHFHAGAALPVSVAVGLAIVPAGIVAMWLLGEVSYRFFEAPLLRFKDRLDGPRS